MEAKDYITSDEGAKLQNVLHKELDLIQAVITRMAQNSFYMKGWCITLVAAIFSLSNGVAREHVYLPLAFMVVVFWFLDSYYLRQERAYRKLYGNVLDCRIKKGIWQNLYSLDAREMLKCIPRVPRIMFSISEWPLYLILCAVLVLFGKGDICRVVHIVGSVRGCVSRASEDVPKALVRKSIDSCCQQTTNSDPLHEHPVIQSNIDKDVKVANTDGTKSMTNWERIGVIGTVIGVCITLVSVLLTKYLASFGKHSEDKFNTDIQNLVQAFRMILLKFKVQSHVSYNFDYEYERGKILDFMVGPSLGVLTKFCAENRCKAFEKMILPINLLLAIGPGGKQPDIVLCRMLFDAIKSLTAKDFKILNRIARDADNSLPTRNVVNSTIDEYLPTGKEHEDQHFEKFIVELYEELKVNDPDVKLRYGVVTNRPEIVSSALDEGADTTTTDKAIKEKYHYHG